jgi:hypothetical protein
VFADIITLGSSLKVETDTAWAIVWLSTSLPVQCGRILGEFEIARNKK